MMKGKREIEILKSKMFLKYPADEKKKNTQVLINYVNKKLEVQWL